MDRITAATDPVARVQELNAARWEITMKQLLYTSPRRWRIPVTIVGGFAGAGKTTLLRHALLHNDGRHIAAIVRDFQQFELDARLIRHCDQLRCVLHNGSVCYSASAGIEAALTSLQSSVAAPEHLLVEAPSTATNRRSTGYAYMPGFRHAGSVIVVNATMLKELAVTDRHDTMVAGYLRGAELIVINQVDRISSSLRTAARRSLLSHAPGACVVETVYGRLPLPMLIGLPTKSVDRVATEEWTEQCAIGASCRRTKAFEPRHDHDYRAWLLTTRRPIHRATFRSWAEQIPDAVLHGDGVVQLDHDPGHRYRFALCGSRWWLEREDAWTHGERLTAISLVGLAGRGSFDPLREQALSLRASRGGNRVPQSPIASAHPTVTIERRRTS